MDERTRIVKAVGANLTARAEELGKSRFTLHKELNLAKAVVYRAFGGRQEPGLHIVVILARALRISLDKLIAEPAGAEAKKPRGPKVARGARTVKRKAKAK